MAESHMRPGELVETLAEIDMLRAENAQLKQRVAELEDELRETQASEGRSQQKIAALKSQLPNGMEHCTIVFKECERGHGWLSATNWIDCCCSTCKRDSLESQLQAAKEELKKYGPIVDAADLKADECGCNVVMRRYSNPFHRVYYKVSRCEFHETAASEHRSLRDQLAAKDAELQETTLNLRARDLDVEALEQENARLAEQLKIAREALTACGMTNNGIYTDTTARLAIYLIIDQAKDALAKIGGGK